MCRRCFPKMRRRWPGAAFMGPALALMALVLVFPAQGVAASTSWCRSDPVVLIDGQLADIFYSVPLDDVLLVNGPTRIIVTVPPDVSIAVASPSPGFGYGESFTFQTSPSLDTTLQGIEMRIKVLVPGTDDTMPVLVDFSPRLVGIMAPVSAEGTANAWVPLSTPH
jgi:hypothetical protein